VVTLFICFRTRQSKAEMALITGSTLIWRDEKSFVKDMLQETFPSRPVDCGAGAVGTNRRFIEDSHTNISQFWLGPLFDIQTSHVSRGYITSGGAGKGRDAI